MNVACNSPDTVSHLVSISLELQRLRTLLKVHPIELHAKLLRACASCLRSSPRAWARHWSSPVEWCNRFVSFGVGYALSWSGGSSCWVGWRACHGVNAHCQRFMCERHARSGAVVPITQATSPTTPRCRRLLSRWFATWALHRPEARPHYPEP